MTETETWLAEVSGLLSQRGFDVVQPFVVDATLDSLFPFPRFEREQCLGVLVGNSRALWRPFVTWCAAENSELEHPLRRYTEVCLQEALGEAACRIFYSHRLDYEAEGRRTAIPIQRLGRDVGNAALGPAHLSAHPVFGPWFAYRAVVVADFPPLVKTNLPITLPCEHCPAPCRKELAKVLAERGMAPVEDHWQAWLGVRDACPVGREFRYPAAQIRYHYTKHPEALGPREGSE